VTEPGALLEVTDGQLDHRVGAVIGIERFSPAARVVTVWVTF
jgi:hypothetical protein